MADQKEVAELTDADLAERGIEAVEDGNLALGLDLLERIPPEKRNPSIRSYLALCLAAERGFLEEAKAICTEVLKKEPGNSLLYLNLGRIYLLTDNKKEAIRMFRDGLLFQENSLIREELDNLGWRNPPVFPSLGREHPINRLLGMIRKRLGPCP